MITAIKIIAGIDPAPGSVSLNHLFIKEIHSNSIDLMSAFITVNC